MENRKIGIVTIVYAENYGAVLQCFALKTALSKRYGKEVYVLAYHSDADKYGYGIIDNTLFRKHLWKQYAKYLMKLPFVVHKKVLRRKVFENFRNAYLKPTKIDKLDVIIYGSDQIWAYNKDFGGYNSIYWGDRYIASKKIAYSASMGKILNADNQFVAEHIFNFDNISVREFELQQFIQKFSSKPISVTLDPTMLLDCSQWDNFADKNSIIKENYILVYNLNGNDVIKSAANYLSDITGLKIVEIFGYSKVQESSYSKSTYTPKEFVTLFKHSSYVLTSSFHGTVFAMIFKKKFWVSQKTNIGRVKSLLDSFDYQKRFIEDSKISISDEIDYSTFDSKLSLLRKKSESYLFNSIQNEI